MKASVIIEVKDLVVRSKKFAPILQGVSFDVYKGDFAVLMGKTGSGKSTLLKSLYLDIEIAEGEVRFLGHYLSKIDRSEINKLAEVRRSMGIIFQDFQLLANRTVEKNLEFVLRCTNWKDSKVINLRVLEVLQKVKMSWALKKMPHELSGGEQQRICIARAILNNPTIIIADEPTGNLDSEVSSEIFALLNELSSLGVTILIATHNSDFISKHKGRLLRFNNGFIVEG